MPGATAFLDFETTGMSAAYDAITDIGLIVVDASGARAEWMRLVNPRRAIPYTITRLTGIDNAMVADAPDFAGVADELVARIGDARIVAHNAAFDMGFLKAGLAACGRTHRFPYVCSVRVARKLFPEMTSRSLDALAARFGLRFAGDRHRALPDAAMLASIWSAMRDAAGAERFDATVDALTADAGGAPTAPPVPPWPYRGPVVVRSTRRTGEWHVFHDWRHLGSVTDEREITVVATRTAVFCRVKYRRIVEALARPDAGIREL